MGDRDKARRRETGVSAQDFVQAPNLGRIEPGKRNLIQSYQLGVDHIDHGTACKGDGDQVAGCFLTEEQRAGVFNELSMLIGMASTNYKLALEELKTRQLLKRDEDLQWALALVLDLVSLQLGSIMQAALKSVQARATAKLEQMMLSAGLEGTFSDQAWSTRAAGMIARATTTRIDAAVKTVFVPATAGAKKIAQKATNTATQTKKAASIAYLDQLEATCDASFLAFYRSVRAHVQDAELVVVWEGLQPEYQEPGIYRDALGAKLDRFDKSGVLDIGRKVTDSPDDPWTGQVVRDTRVVFVQDIAGNKTPWYQRQDGAFNPDVVSPGDPDYNLLDPGDLEHKAAWAQFGPRLSRDPRLDKPVPDEFRDAAIAYSEARWGATVTIDDGYVTALKSQGVSIDEMRKRLRGSPLYKSPSAFPDGRTPWDTPPAPAPLPTGSVFADRGEQLGGDELPAGSIFAAQPKRP